MSIIALFYEDQSMKSVGPPIFEGNFVHTKDSPPMHFTLHFKKDGSCLVIKMGELAAMKFTVRALILESMFQLDKVTSDLIERAKAKRLEEAKSEDPESQSKGGT